MATKSNMFVYLVECLHFFLSSCRYLGTTVGISDLDPLSWADCLVGNFSTSQDVQSQITSVSLADSQAFSRPDFPDN